MMSGVRCALMHMKGIPEIQIVVFFFRKENILISQLLHSSMHMAVPYYKPERNGPGYLKNKVLRHKVKKGLKTSTRKQFYY